MIKAVLITVALGLAPVAAYAEDTVVEHHDTTVAPVPDTAVVHEHSTTDCSQQTVHKENSAGDSKTVSRTNC